MNARILLIEDDLVLQDSIFELLHQYGFVVEAFSSPKLALKRFKNAPFDLILCDYSMPEMDGYDVLKNIKEIRPDEHIPFIMTTAYSDTKIFRQAMNMGADDFISKPFKSDDLISAINKELKKTKFWQQKLEGYADFPIENPNPVIRYFFREKKFDFTNEAYDSKIKKLTEAEKEIFVEHIENFAQNAVELNSLLKQNIAIKNELFNVSFSPQVAKGYVNIYFSDITLIRKTEEQLKNQEIYISQLLENIPADIVVLSPEMRYIYINKNAVKNQTTREWLIGKSDNEYLNYKEHKYSEAIQNRIEIFNQLRAGKHVDNWVDKYEDQQGKATFVLRKYHPVFNDENKLSFVIGYGIDISGMMEAEEKLNISRQRYKSLFDSNPQMVLIVNNKEQIVEVNDATIKLLGFKKEDLINQSIIEIFPQEKHFEILQQIDNCFTHQEFENTWETINKTVDGKLLDIHVVARTIYLQDSNEKLLLVVGTDVTEKKNYLRLLEESSAFNKMLLKEMPVPVAILKFDKFVEVNGTFKHLFGYDTDILKDASLLDFVEPQYKEELMRKMHERYQNSTRVMECEVEMFSQNSNRFNILLNGTLYNHQNEKFTLVIFNNITEIRQAQLREYAAEHRSKLILNSTLDAVVQFDRHAKIIDWNLQAEKLFGYTSSESVGQKFDKLLLPKSNKQQYHEEQGGVFIEFIKGTLNKLVEFTVHDKYKKTVEIELYVIEIETENDVIYTAFLRNIDERKAAELQAKLFVNELTYQNEELKRFAYITSHDLRAPVLNLTALLDHYDSNNGNSELNNQIIDLLKQSTDRISNTLNDLIEITKVKDRTYIDDIEACNVYQLLNEIKVEQAELILIATPIIKLNSYQVEFIRFSKKVLKSIFSNLISNALKFRSDERQLTIEITIKQYNGFHEIRVKDNGLGMDMKKAGKRPFSIYQKYHSNIHGKGFGLYLLKLQLETLNGTLDFDSTLGEGSEFIVSIPSNI